MSAFCAPVSVLGDVPRSGPVLLAFHSAQRRAGAHPAPCALPGWGLLFFCPPPHVLGAGAGGDLFYFL